MNDIIGAGQVVVGYRLLWYSVSEVQIGFSTDERSKGYMSVIVLKSLSQQLHFEKPESVKY